MRVKKLTKTEKALAWLDDIADDGNQMDQRARRQLRKIVEHSEEFAKLWAVWSVSPVMCPDEETIEAASRLMVVLGVEQPECE